MYVHITGPVASLPMRMITLAPPAYRYIYLLSGLFLCIFAISLSTRFSHVTYRAHINQIFIFNNWKKKNYVHYKWSMIKKKTSKYDVFLQITRSFSFYFNRCVLLELDCMRLRVFTSRQRELSHSKYVGPMNINWEYSLVKISNCYNVEIVLIIIQNFYIVVECA